MQSLKRRHLVSFCGRCQNRSIELCEKDLNRGYRAETSSAVYKCVNTRQEVGRRRLLKLIANIGSNYHNILLSLEDVGSNYKGS